MDRKAKTLAILGAGQEQVIAIRLARELGYRVIAVDDSEDAPGRSFADHFIQTTIKDHEQLVSALEPFRIDGIMTHAAELAIETAHVAEHFQLPGIGKRTAELGTIKHLRIEHLKKAGIHVPGYGILDPGDSLEKWFREGKRIGYPLVAKPVNNKGAFGVLLIKDEKAIELYFKDVRPGLRSDKFLLEKYLLGIQYSTESIIQNGKFLRHTFALRHYSGMERFHPYLIEDGHSMPAEIDQDVRRMMIRQIESSGNVMGMKNGVLKGDLLIDKHSTPWVLEMAARSSGGRFADFVTVKQCGVQILYAMIQIAMNEKVDARTLEERWNRGVSQRFLFLEPGTRIRQIPEADVIRAMKGVETVEFSPDFISSLEQKPITHHGARIGYVVCTGDTRGEADEFAKQTCRLIEASFEPA